MHCWKYSCTIILIAVFQISVAYGGKYRFCVVDGKATYRKSAIYCPTLDQPDSKVECIVGLDRLDCLRRIQKNKADFAVLTAEDLVTATNSEYEILVTNKVRYTKDDNEYEVVAVIDNRAGIKSKHDLKDQRFCHPGYGYEADWTRILANYFEASVVTPQCDTTLTIPENRIRASSKFFISACKAGPWVNNETLDAELKRKYPNLCSLCDNAAKCSKQDKYWGRRGSLLCLTDGAGDISWARLDDVKQHFGLTPGGTEASPDEYSLLCPDDSVMPLNTTNPCVWVVKPWPVVGSRRAVAQEIQQVIATLSHEDRTSWRSKLLNLLEMSYAYIDNVNPVQPIESYLDDAKGFLNANSFSACHPPRTIKICTTSIIEHAKCSWMRESAAVYGIEPDLECILASNTTHCMVALNDNVADVVMVPSDMVHIAKSKYNLRTLFYETVTDKNKYITVPVVRSDSDYKYLEDLKGVKACFPTYDGVAWNTVANSLYNSGLINGCSLDSELSEFFGSSCVPGLPKNEHQSMVAICQDEFKGEFGALHCLTSGVGDVAFASRNSLESFVSDDRLDNPGSREKLENFRVLCSKSQSKTFKSHSCHLSWAPIGQAMVRANRSDLWLDDTLDVFQQLDNLFGKNYKSLTSPFSMFGKYDGQSDILFHDVTVTLRTVPTAKNTDTMLYPYDRTVLENVRLCRSGAQTIGLSYIIGLSTVFVTVFKVTYN